MNTKIGGGDGERMEEEKVVSDSNSNMYRKYSMSHIVFAAWNGDSTLPFVKLHIASNMHTVSKVQIEIVMKPTADHCMPKHNHHMLVRLNKNVLLHTGAKCIHTTQNGVHSLEYHGNLNDKFIEFQDSSQWSLFVWYSDKYSPHSVCYFFSFF